jgi:hypothetical protein
MIAWIGMCLRAFFGWSPNPSNDPEIPQYETTWFVEELIDVWNKPDTWNTQIDTIDIDTKDYTEIRVMMPKYFYNSGWKKFAQELFNDKKVYMKFIFIDDLNWYQNQLFNKDFSGADLFLFPYDWHEKISTKSFSAQQDIQPYFDQILSILFDGNQTSFLPFAADPMVMYTLPDYSWPNNFYQISEYTLNREPIKVLAFPLFFGLTSEDFEDRWYKWEYQDIVWYALMHYFQTNNDSHDLQIRIDSNVLEKYNISNIKIISNAFTVPECKYFPSICLQTFNFVWIRFGFLSDTDIINLYLHDKKSDFSKIKKMSMPFSQLESPIRIRWRWMPDSLQNPETINWVYAFFIHYMNNYNQYNLRNSTLPVFKTNNEWNWLLDNEYIWLRWYILTSWWDYINTAKQISKFQDLIEYKIDSEEYLR